MVIYFVYGGYGNSTNLVQFRVHSTFKGFKFIKTTTVYVVPTRKGTIINQMSNLTMSVSSLFNPYFCYTMTTWFFLLVYTYDSLFT